LFRIAAPHDREVAVARLNARLGDDLADDDTAYAILPAAGGVRVLLVSAGDPPLEKVLGLLPGVEVDEASPSSYAGFGAVSGYDVYVLDGVDPIAGRPIPGGAFIWGGADPQFTTAGGGDTSVPVVDWDRSQPVMRFDDLSDTLLRAPAWGSVGAWSPLIEDSQGIVAAAIENGTQRQVRVSFTPQSSGFSTQAAFPIFVSNAITWLAEQAGQSAPAGTPIALAPEPGGWTVTGPAGKQAGLCDQFGSACSVSQTQPAGIYSVHSSGGDLLFTRNTDASESDIVPKAHAIATAPLAVSAPNLSRVIWVQATWAVAALCLCLLIAEWLVYHRPSRPGQRPARK
jgi:hypothetical protein